MTFTINSTDCSSYLTKYGYSTTYTPIYASSVTTLDGVEHTALIRHRGTLKVTIKPMTATDWATFISNINGGIMSITYSCLQRGIDVTANMRLDPVSADLVLINTSRTVYGNCELTFVEL